MILADVLGELMAAAEGAGVAVPERWGDRPPRPPLAVVELPERVVFDVGGTGFDRYPSVSLVVIVGEPASPHSYRALTGYLDGTGPQSVKAAVEAYAYTACGTVRVIDAVPDVVTLAGVDFLAAVFHIDVTGRR